MPPVEWCVCLLPTQEPGHLKKYRLEVSLNSTRILRESTVLVKDALYSLEKYFNII